jgi:hypothetical protein
MVRSYLTKTKRKKGKDSISLDLSLALKLRNRSLCVLFVLTTLDKLSSNSNHTLKGMALKVK